MTTRRYLDQRLRLHQLRAVHALETQRSLLKASAALGVTQPALTKTLHELEDVLQLQLFDRHPRGVRPTEAGRVFVQVARRVLAELRRLDDELDRLSSARAAAPWRSVPCR
jgi:LysR family transcriptional regulator, pca operon transcriptional activator